MTTSAFLTWANKNVAASVSGNVVSFATDALNFVSSILEMLSSNGCEVTIKYSSSAGGVGDLDTLFVSDELCSSSVKDYYAQSSGGNDRNCSLSNVKFDLPLMLLTSCLVYWRCFLLMGVKSL